MLKRESEKAMDRIQLTDSDWKKINSGKDYKANIIAKRWIQQKKKENQIYLSYVRDMPITEDSRELCIAKLQEQWGYTSPKYISNIIEKFDKNPELLSAETRNKVYALRDINLWDAFKSNWERVQELEGQIATLQCLRNGGNVWYEAEEIDESGDRGKSVKTKKITIDDRLLSLTKQKTDLYRDLYDTMNKISPQVEKFDGTMKHELDISPALQAMLDANDKINRAVPADAEVVVE